MTSKLKLFPGIYALKYGGLLVENGAKKVLVIADLHLGYELELTNAGIAMPAFQLTEMEDKLAVLTEEHEPSEVVINGDLKHLFSGIGSQEWGDVRRFVAFVKERARKVVVVRGNHDNYLKTILKRSAVPFFDHYYAIGNTIVIHGHEQDVHAYSYKNIVIGHDHPAIALRDEAGGEVKVPCFVYGKLRNSSLVMMPAFSPLALGVDVLSSSKNDYLCPLMREADLDNFQVIAVDEEKLLKFPAIGKIRSAVRL